MNRYKVQADRGDLKMGVCLKPTDGQSSMTDPSSMDTSFATSITPGELRMASIRATIEGYHDEHRDSAADYTHTTRRTVL